MGQSTLQRRNSSNQSRSQGLGQSSDCDFRQNHPATQGQADAGNTNVLGHRLELRTGGSPPSGNNGSARHIGRAYRPIRTLPQDSPAFHRHRVQDCRWQRGWCSVAGPQGQLSSHSDGAEGATGARVAVSEKDREFVPTGVEAKVVKESEAEKTAESKETGVPPKDPATGTIAVSSTPDGGEISVDGAFMGNAPATLKLSPGKHTIRVALSGFKEWTREITVLAGSELKLAAALEKQN